jgi:hypothetical protein
VSLIEHRVHPLPLVLERPVIAYGTFITVAVLPGHVGSLRLHPARARTGRRIRVCQTGSEAEHSGSEPAGYCGSCNESLQFHGFCLSVL